MRHFVISATALLISATLGVAAALSQTATPPGQENLQDKQQLPGSPQYQHNVDKALESESGRAGKQEPLPQTKSDDTAPLVNGALNVPAYDCQRVGCSAGAGGTTSMKSFVT